MMILKQAPTSNMTKIKLNHVVLATLIATAITPAFAEESISSSFFVYGKIGQAKTDVNNQQLIESINATMSNAQLTTVDDSGAAAGLGIGYQFNSWFSVELGYADLGERIVSYTTTSLDEAYYPNLSTVYPKSANGLSFSINAFWPINNDIKVGAKLGTLRWKSDLDTVEGSDNVQHYKGIGNDIWFGIEANYQLTTSLQLFTTYDHYGIDTQDVDFFGVGARYYFEHQTKKQAKVPPVVTATVAPEYVTSEPVPRTLESNTPVQITLAALPLPFELVLLFENDKEVLQDSALEALAEIGYTLSTYQSDITISGHTSSNGPQGYNQALSERRAEIVAQYLKETFGVTANHVQGFGEQQLKEQGNDAKNRRVEINIVFM